MTPNGDAVARFKDEADGARDVFCGWRVTFETGGNSTDEGATLAASAARRRDRFSRAVRRRISRQDDGQGACREDKLVASEKRLRH